MSDKTDFEKILEFAVANGASDIHFRAGEPPVLRVRGKLHNINIAPLDVEKISEICKTLVSSSSVPIELSQIREYDGSFDLGDLGRFRFNVFKHEGSYGAVLRVIPSHVPTIEGLGFPDVIKNIARMERGLVLVTGATGQGKSTTIAAMMDYLNNAKRYHIITIEDPIEFIHRPKRSKITQREVGRDTSCFADALRAALRQDPDVILVGELRDAESIDVALKASETGHTVFSTLHTTDAAKSIARIISMFPADEQSLVRLRLADCLKATISQRLLPRMDGKGRVVAQEIMISNTAIAECIADPMRTAEIPTFIENAQSLLGSQTFKQHLSSMYHAGIISMEVAKQASANAADFEHAINYEKNDLGNSNTSEIQAPHSGRTLQMDSSLIRLEGHAGNLPRPKKHDDDSGNHPIELDGSSRSGSGLINKVLRAVKKA